MSNRAFVRWLAVVVAVGGTIRLLIVAFASRALAFGDGIWYHSEAQIIGGGFGFLAPGQYVFGGRHLATAEHPPLYPALLGVLAWMGHTSVLGFQLTDALLGTAGIVVIGLLGRAVGGARVGVIAAALAAVSPNIWQYDTLVLSESLLVLTLGLFLLVVHQFWNRPRPRDALLLGVTLALATYTRVEMVFLGLLIVVPVVLWNPRLEGSKARIRTIAVAGAVTVALLAPWVARNLTTFERPVLISNNQDSVIAGANCEPTYEGRGIGSWSPVCNTEHVKRFGEQSAVFAEIRHRGLTYATDHVSRLPLVALARIGRTWEVFQPFQDIGNDGRDDAVWIASTLTFYVMVLLGVAGAVQLRRSGRLIWPLVVMAPFVTVLAVGTYGLARLRFPLDIALLVLAAVPIERFLIRRVGTDAGTEPEPEPVVVQPS
jgi:Predicted membrane protein